MSTDERSLADISPEQEIDDSVETPRPQINVDEFLSGVRAQRRAVKIRPNLHRLADMERLVDQIDELPEDEDADDLIDAYEQARDDFLAFEWWVVEQRTHERRRHVRRQAAKDHDITLTDDGENVVGDDADGSGASKVEAYVIADHVVEPANITADDITALYEASPGEYMKVDIAVAQVMRVVNEQQVKEALRDFSSRRSGKTAGSSRR